MASKTLTTATALATVMAQFGAAPAMAQPWPTPAYPGTYPGYPGGYPGQGAYPGQGGTIVCRSEDRRYQECPLPQRGASVQLVRQFSNTQCIEGRNWGQRSDVRGGVLWVSGGCQAEFALTSAGYPGGGYPGGGYPGGGYPGGGWQGAGQGYARQIRCDSRDFRDNFCPVDTQGRVEIIRVNRGQCAPGRDWTFDAQGIRVRNDCRALFGVGYAGGGYPGGGGWQGGGGFAAVRECESRDYRPETCFVNTQGRVQLLRLEGGQCQEGRDWTYDNRAIYVRNGCRARFGYGYGNVTDAGGGGGIGTGGIIAGVAIAAGLAALLASRGKRSTAAQGGPAQVSANLNLFPAEARNDARLCIDEAARQVGATGGSRLTLERVDGAFREGNGYRVTARLSALYDGRTQPLAMLCTTANGRVAGFDVR